MAKKTKSIPSDTNRRRFLRWTGLFGAATLAGCAGDDDSGDDADDDTTGTGDDDPPAGVEVHGGTLNISVGRNPDTVNPIVQGNLPEYMFTSWTYSNLVISDADLEIQPQLATDWESNEDATQWTFNLTPDATFHHDGSQVTAMDVAASFRKGQDPDVGSIVEGQFGEVDSFEAVDETTFRINLEEPFPSVPELVATPQFRVLPEEIIEDDERFSETASQEYGSGPFVQEEFEPGNRVVVSRYDDYFETDENGNELPYLDEIVMEIFPDESAQLSALETGDLDINPEIPASSWPRVEGMDVEPHARTSAEWVNVVMRTDREPFDDNRVRKAFRVAVDRESMMEGAIDGLGTVTQDNVVPPTWPQYTELPELGPDRDQARELLAEAGYEDGLDLSEFGEDMILQAADSPDLRLDVALQLQEQLSEVGIEFEVEQISYDRFLNNVWTQAPFYIGFYVTRPIPVATYTSLFTSDASWEETAWSNEDFDEAVRDAQTATSPEEAEEAYARAQEIMHEHSPTIIPFFMDSLGANQHHVNGYWQETGLSNPAAHTWRMYLDEEER